jgi:hypothetical protein
MALTKKKKQSKQPDQIQLCRKLRKSVMEETLDFLKSLKEDMSTQKQIA